MKKVIVSLGERSYPIIIENGLLMEAGKHLRSMIGSGKAIIISDTNVFNLFGATLTSSFISEGIKVKKIIVPPGEGSKSLSVASNIYLELAKNNIERGDFVIALGGGVIGDLAGFVASTYLRGLNFIQVPTTLLSQIDSSIGGKVGVNLNSWKNLVGSFYQPKAVLIDVGIIERLPEAEKSNGLAEIIKTAFISGEYLVAFLESRQDDLMNLDRTSLALLIEECCRYKASIIEKDEKEQSLRRILNYGHTFGHAVESVTSPRWTHGQSVAMGIVFAALLGFYKGLVSNVVVQRQVNLIKKAGLPTSLPKLDEAEAFKALNQDKKKSDGGLWFVIVKTPGNTRLVEVDDKTIRTVYRDFKDIYAQAMS